jgi:hypothetical protein
MFFIIYFSPHAKVLLLRTLARVFQFFADFLSFSFEQRIFIANKATMMLNIAIMHYGSHEKIKKYRYGFENDYDFFFR